MAADMTNHKKVLEKIAELITKQQDCCAVIDVNQQNWIKELEAQKRKTGEEFMVLIVGAFNSGKSSLINALTGEEFLPTGMLPETGVLCEIHYGTEKSITLYPKPGKWEGGDDPFPLDPPSVSQIAKYCSIDNAAQMSGNVTTSNMKFEKVVICWPLDILKEGIVLVDSVGMNDPFGNDFITKAYFPKADAVIYLLNGTAPYTQTDEDLLYEINDYGIHNIINVCTYFDQVQQNHANAPEKLKAYCDTIRSHCAEHSTLGSEAVHFVNSRGALKAKLNGDPQALVESGIAGLEQYMSQYLVENKGRDQVDVISRYLFVQSGKMRDSVKVQNAASMMSQEELQTRVTMAKEQLALASKNTATASKNFRTLMLSCLDKLDIMIAAHAKTLPDQVTLDDFVPETKLPAGIANLNVVAVNRKAKALSEECSAAVVDNAKKVNKKWIDETLFATLNDHVAKCASGVQIELEEIAHELNSINNTLTGEPHKDSGLMDAASKALLFITGILISDIGLAANGAAYGGRGALRAIGFEFAAGLALGVIEVAFGIATAPYMVPAAVVAGILAAVTDSTEAKIKSVKKEAVKTYRKNYEKNHSAQQNEEALKKAVRDWIDGMCKCMDDALEEDIAEKRKLIEATISSANADIEEKERARKKREEAISTLSDIAADLNGIRMKYNLPELEA